MLADKNLGVSNLQLAPHGVISTIVPLSGNAPALGTNLFTRADERNSSLQVVRNRALTIVGPFNL